MTENFSLKVRKINFFRQSDFSSLTKSVETLSKIQQNFLLKNQGKNLENKRKKKLNKKTQKTKKKSKKSSKFSFRIFQRSEKSTLN